MIESVLIYQIIIIILLIVMSAFFSSSETALTSYLYTKQLCESLR